MTSQRVERTWIRTGGSGANGLTPYQELVTTQRLSPTNKCHTAKDLFCSEIRYLYERLDNTIWQIISTVAFNSMIL